MKKNRIKKKLNPSQVYIPENQNTAKSSVLNKKHKKDQEEHTEESNHYPGSQELKKLIDRLHFKAPRNLGKEVISGLNIALNTLPLGMGGSLLAGVSPIMGLYASIFAPIAGGLTTSTFIMVVATTNAAALTSGQIIQGYPEGTPRENALILLTFLTGIIMMLVGIFKIGKMLRYVSYSVMTGFLTGITFLTILSQLPVILGFSVPGANKIAQTAGLFTHLELINIHTLFISLLTLIFAVWLSHTKLKESGIILAIIIPSAITYFFKWTDVATAGVFGDITGTFPSPSLPDFTIISPSLIIGSLSLAAVLLIQGAGISQGMSNPDGSDSNVSKDITAQGFAGTASSIFGGMPAGGSIASTAVNLLSGGNSRLSPIFSGLWVLTFFMIFPGLISKIAMASLSIILVLAGINAIKYKNAVRIWNTRMSSALSITITFLATILLPIQYAVVFGIAISILLYFYTSSRDVSIFQLKITPEGFLKELPPPVTLPDNSVTILQMRGTLYYAGARSIESLWPKIASRSFRPVVILRLREPERLGATLIEVIDRFAQKLEKAGGRLYISELTAKAMRQFTASEKHNKNARPVLYRQTPVLGQTTLRAYKEAVKWLENTTATGE